MELKGLIFTICPIVWQSRTEEKPVQQEVEDLFNDATQIFVVQVWAKINIKVYDVYLIGNLH